MDGRLIAWARAVKRRRKTKFPVLWLFTDEVRLPDPMPAIRALPSGLCGVVFRHDATPNRAALGRQLAKLCRARRLVFVAAGDPRLAAAMHAGLHLRAGRRSLLRPHDGLVTSSAHNMTEIRRAAAAGAKIIFISPAFATASHPGARGLSAIQWNNLARRAPHGTAYALGGVDGQKMTSLASFCCGAGAITALT
jgi:thiamine-phosphate pyrophosphorylase